MMSHTNRSRALAPFTLLFASMIAACGGTTTTPDVVADSASDTVQSDTAPTCPSDLTAADGQPCTMEGQICGGPCTSPCSFCNELRCSSGHWTHVEILPGACDAGDPTDAAFDAGSDAAPDVVGSDAAGVTCGTTTCGAGQVCVHSVSTGGACRFVDDGGTCGPGERLAGSCCVGYSESYWCDQLPAACDPTVSCGCAESLCTGDGGNACPCMSASSTNVECFCALP